MADIYVNYGKDAMKMTYELMETGGVGDGLRGDMKVVLKPNLVLARTADSGATTHPEIVEGCVKYLKDAGVSDITIAEGTWVGDSTKSALQVCGYNQLDKRYGLKIVDTKKDEVVKRKARGMELALCATPLEADYLINFPVLKGHCQTDMTCCLKNLKGCIPDSEKRRYHSMGLHKPIAALNTVLVPHLHIVDSICGDLTFEEGGNPVASNRILLGFDGVLLDSYCASLMGYQAEEIAYIKLAAQYGVGVLFGPDTEIVELNAHKQPKTLPTASRIATKLGDYIQEDGACSACYAALIFALHKAGGRMVEGERIKIGQGFQGKALGGMGVGKCAQGCKYNVPGCPPRAVDIVEMLGKV